MIPLRSQVEEKSEQAPAIVVSQGIRDTAPISC